MYFRVELSILIKGIAKSFSSHKRAMAKRLASYSTVFEVFVAVVEKRFRVPSCRRACPSSWAHSTLPATSVYWPLMDMMAG